MALSFGFLFPYLGNVDAGLLGVMASAEPEHSDSMVIIPFMEIYSDFLIW